MPGTPATEATRCSPLRRSRAWSKRGVEFGAHSRTHPNLDHLTYDQAELEILGSRKDLEELVQQPVRSFAYPWGVAGRSVDGWLLKNFALAFSDSDGPNTRDVDPHAIKRTMVQPTDGGSDLNSRVRFGRSLKQDARARLGKVRSALRRTASEPVTRASSPCRARGRTSSRSGGTFQQC